MEGAPTGEMPDQGFHCLGNPLLFVSVGWFVPVWVVLCLCLRVKLPNLCQLCVHIHVDNFSKVTRQTAILYLSMQAKGFMSCTVPNISCTMTLRTSRPRRWTKSSEKRQCPRFFCHERQGVSCLSFCVLAYSPFRGRGGTGLVLFFSLGHCLFFRGCVMSMCYQKKFFTLGEGKMVAVLALFMHL